MTKKDVMISSGQECDYYYKHPGYEETVYDMVKTDNGLQRFNLKFPKGEAPAEEVKGYILVASGIPFQMNRTVFTKYV